MPEPTFSIIIPTRNRAAQLTNCLGGLARLDYPRQKFEVIVVDDGSDASPGAVVAAFSKQLDMTLLERAHEGPSAARNAGAAVARGRFLAFTDDDCTPAQDWLQALQARFRRTPFHAIGGPTVNAYPENIYAATSQLIVDMMFASYNTDPNRACFLASNNLAVPAELFHAILGFDARHFPLAAGEDRDICERWREQGHGIVYAPEVRVFHAHRLTLRSFCRQHLNRGRAAFWLQQARRRRGSAPSGEAERSLAETFRLATGRLAKAGWSRALPIAVLLVVWRACHAAGLAWEWLHTQA